MTREDKAAYDREYRAKNRERLRRKKAAYFQRTYDPINAAIERKGRMPQHVEYCRRPEYRVKKQQYDEEKRASAYADYAESFLLLKELRKEIHRQEPDRMERYRQSGRGPWSLLTYEKRRINRAKENERNQGRSEQSEGVDGPKPEERIMEHSQRSARAQGASRQR